MTQLHVRGQLHWHSAFGLKLFRICPVFKSEVSCIGSQPLLTYLLIASSDFVLAQLQVRGQLYLALCSLTGPRSAVFGPMPFDTGPVKGLGPIS